MVDDAIGDVSAVGILKPGLSSPVSAVEGVVVACTS